MFPRITIATFLFVHLSDAIIPIADLQDLIGVVQIFRHGEKTPDFQYETDPLKNKLLNDLGPGQLTKKGKIMSYDLGEFTRQRYAGFLPQTYDAKWFRAYSTDNDATLMSAELNLAALFPPKQEESWNPYLQWQPIPVHPVPEEILSSFPDCPVYFEQLDNLLKREPIFRAINYEYLDTYEYIKNNSGFDVTVGPSAVSFYDILQTQDILGWELPEWTKAIYPEPMKFIGESSLKAFFYTDQMKRFAAGPWLNAVFTQFVDLFEDSESYPKFQIYSANDFNIAAILRTLGDPEPFHWPAFSDSLYFEFRNKSGIPTMNIWYKDNYRGVFRSINGRGCGFDCSLGNFGRSMRQFLVSACDWKDECTARRPSKTSSTAVGHFFGIMYQETLQHIYMNFRVSDN